MKKRIGFLAFLACMASALFCQSITVTSPRAGVTWNRDSTYTIQWTTAAEPVPRPLIDIYLLKGGRWVRDITRGAPDSGSFSWRVPADAPLGACTIQVTWVGTSISGYSPAFNIATGLPPASLQLISPNGSENWEINTWHLVQWSYIQSPPITASSQVRLILFQNDSRIGAITQGTSIGANGRGSFNWKVGVLDNGMATPGQGFKIRIEHIGVVIADWSDNPFTISSPGQPLGTFDLEPTDFYFENDAFKFKVRNNGETFSGDFNAIRDFNASGLGLMSAGFPHVSIASHEEKTFSFPGSGWPGGNCGINGRLIIVTAPAESRTDNNTLSRMVWRWPHALSHIEFPVQVGTSARVVAYKDGEIKLRDYNLFYHNRVKDCHNVDATLVEFLVQVKIRNCGGQPSSKLDLVIYLWTACPDHGLAMANRQSGIVIQPGETKTITLNVKGHFWYQPHLRAWREMRIVLFDGDTPGKNAMFTSQHIVMLEGDWAD